MVTTQEPMANRAEPGFISRDLNADLLSLVSSGCTVEDIVQRLGLTLDEVHSRLVDLRLIIEDVSRATSTD